MKQNSLRERLEQIKTAVMMGADLDEYASVERERCSCDAICVCGWDTDYWIEVLYGIRK